MVVIVRFEHVPLCHDDDGSGPFCRFLWTLEFDQPAPELFFPQVVQLDFFDELNYSKSYVFESRLGVVNVQSGAFQKHVIANFDCWRLSGIVGVFLECSTENADLLAFEVLVQLSVNSQEEVLLSELVHEDDLIPVIGHFRQSFVLCQVNQGQDVLLEAASSEADRTVQELVPDSGVRCDALLHFLHIRSVLFAHDGNAVDRRDSLGQETVCGKFGQFG